MNSSWELGDLKSNTSGGHQFEGKLVYTNSGSRFFFLSLPYLIKLLIISARSLTKINCAAIHFFFSLNQPHCRSEQNKCILFYLFRRMFLKSLCGPEQDPEQFIISFALFFFKVNILTVQLLEVL